MQLMHELEIADRWLMLLIDARHPARTSADGVPFALRIGSGALGSWRDVETGARAVSRATHQGLSDQAAINAVHSDAAGAVTPTGGRSPTLRSAEPSRRRRSRG